MDRRPLGRTGLTVSPIGLGTVKFGRNQAVKYPRAFDLPTDERIVALLELAQDLGVNLVDTAPAYGESEQRLGRLLPPPRDQWVIVTKAGEEFEQGRSRFDFSPEHIHRSVERSLRRLRTDVLDLVLVHSNGSDRRIIESGTLDALADLKHRGDIRAFGMSTKTVEGGLLAVERCDAVMVTFNANETQERPVIQAARAAGCGVLVKKALGSGWLADRAGGDVEDAIGEAMRLVLGEPGVTAAVVGTINPDHLRRNVQAAERALRD